MISAQFKLLLRKLRRVVNHLEVNRLSSGNCSFVRNQEEIISVISLILNQSIVKAGSRRRILYIVIALIEKSVGDVSINNAIYNFGVVALLCLSDNL